MVTIVYNIAKPEQGGVGRYTYELLNGIKKRIKFNEINLLPSFGNNGIEKLLSALWKRKSFLNSQLDKFSDVNHFVNAELFYHFKGHGNFVVTLHNPPPFTGVNNFENIMFDPIALSRSLLFFRRYKEALNSAELLIANSQFTKDGCLESHADENGVKVINFGIDGRLRIVKKFDERGDVLGYVGSFSFHKRVGKLINDICQNYGKMKMYNMFLYGSSGTLLKSLKEKYDGKFGVSFKGLLNYGSSLFAFNSFKAFIMPSKWESLGLPIIEAVACGTPVFIYTDSKITPEVKKYCMEIENVSEIPEALDSVKQNELVKKSREVKKLFDWGKCVDETIKVYKKLGQ